MGLCYSTGSTPSGSVLPGRNFVLTGVLPAAQTARSALEQRAVEEIHPVMLEIPLPTQRILETDATISATPRGLIPAFVFNFTSERDEWEFLVVVWQILPFPHRVRFVHALRRISVVVHPAIVFFAVNLIEYNGGLVRWDRDPFPHPNRLEKLVVASNPVVAHLAPLDPRDELLVLPEILVRLVRGFRSST